MIFQEPGDQPEPGDEGGRPDRRGDRDAHRPARRAARAKAVEWLRRVGIPEPERRIDDYPFRMSGGQKQRVMIAMTLAAEPDYLVADEPTTALDVTIQAQILDLLRDLQREQGMGMLLITHDLAVVAGMAQRVALMYAGQIIEVARRRSSLPHRASLCAGIAAGTARRASARRGTGCHRRHGARADDAIRRMPFRAALHGGNAALRQYRSRSGGGGRVALGALPAVTCPVPWRPRR
jgi:energy-coupling factor transporter ATP-binding protein EcfA2